MDIKLTLILSDEAKNKIDKLELPSDDELSSSELLCDQCCHKLTTGHYHALGTHKLCYLCGSSNGDFCHYCNQKIEIEPLYLVDSGFLGEITISIFGEVCSAAIKVDNVVCYTIKQLSVMCAVYGQMSGIVKFGNISIAFGEECVLVRSTYYEYSFNRNLLTIGRNKCGPFLTTFFQPMTKLRVAIGSNSFYMFPIYLAKAFTYVSMTRGMSAKKIREHIEEEKRPYAFYKGGGTIGYILQYCSVINGEQLITLDDSTLYDATTQLDSNTAFIGALQMYGQHYAVPSHRVASFYRVLKDISTTGCYVLPPDCILIEELIDILRLEQRLKSVSSNRETGKVYRYIKHPSHKI